MLFLQKRENIHTFAPRKNKRHIVFGIFYTIRDWFFATTFGKGDCLKYYFTAFVYVGALLWFAHFDLCIEKAATIDTSEEFSFLASLMNKHSNSITFVTNIGMLALLVFDLLITDKSIMSACIVTVINLIAMTSVIVIFWSAMNSVYPSLDAFKMANSKTWFCLAFIAYILSMVYVKYKTLQYPGQDTKN